MSDPDRHRSLTEFLLARIAEDETRHCEWGCHERIQAEAKAKRAIADLSASTDHWEINADAWTVAKWALRLAALPYADHPDYRQEWRP